jgi:hypothetical protein
MPNRREFLKDVASGTAGLILVPQAGGPGRRREVTVGGRRVKVVDVHGHCLVPEVMSVIKDPTLAGTFKNLLGGGNLVLGPDRLRYMDEQGIDVQALSINTCRPIVAGRMRSADAVRAPIARRSRNVPANTSRRSFSWTRWSSTKRDCGI